MKSTHTKVLNRVGKNIPKMQRNKNVPVNQILHFNATIIRFFVFRRSFVFLPPKRYLVTKKFLNVFLSMAVNMFKVYLTALNFNRRLFSPTSLAMSNTLSSQCPINSSQDIWKVDLKARPFLIPFKLILRIKTATTKLVLIGLYHVKGLRMLPFSNAPSYKRFILKL